MPAIASTHSTGWVAAWILYRHEMVGHVMWLMLILSPCDIHLLFLWVCIVITLDMILDWMETCMRQVKVSSFHFCHEMARWELLQLIPSFPEELNFHSLNVKPMSFRGHASKSNQSRQRLSKSSVCLWNEVVHFVKPKPSCRAQMKPLS